MPRTIRWTIACASVVVALTMISVGVSGQIFLGAPPPAGGNWQAQPSSAQGEWPHYNADIHGTRYSPLDQINVSNFGKLEVAWRVKTDAFGPRPEFKLEGTPIMVKGVLYTTAGVRRAVIALEARNGEVLWTHSIREGKRAVVSPRCLLLARRPRRRPHRVCHHWLPLVEPNAQTGAMVRSFGTNGVVDLK